MAILPRCPHTSGAVTSTTLTQSTPKRELYSLGLYRVLEAATMAALVFTPLGTGSDEILGGTFMGLVATFYLVAACVFLLSTRREEWLIPLVVGGTMLDIAVAGLATHALPQVAGGIAMLLLFNVAAAAMLLTLRHGMALALLASTTLALEFAWTASHGAHQQRSLTELLMFAASYLGLAWMGYQVGHRARTSQKEAGSAKRLAANLVEINELIIRRMRTGVLVVDEANQITLANEAASALLDENTNHLDQMAPELVKRLEGWRATGETDESPLALFADRPDILPRFASILADEELTVIFLDDASVSARRAETMTLATMGRFSASLAHEVRNPLAAISYATQLLEEMRKDAGNQGPGEERLIEIIRNQTTRTNHIVESVLSLARREQSLPIQMDLGEFVQKFVAEQQQTATSENDLLDADVPEGKTWAMVDPRHLHQILTALVHNAFKYGRSEDTKAHVRVRVIQVDHYTCVDVMDRGDGVPEHIAKQLFQPFFTTSENGTGLGLYIAHELARANQAKLSYLEVPGGGACFRVCLLSPGSGLGT